MKLGVFVLGILFICVAIIFSGMLVTQYMAGVSLPGCGENSPCALITNGAWGRVPGVDWPVSCVGFAYFIAVLVGWFLCNGTNGVSLGFRWIVRIAALLSLLFLIVMIEKGSICLYCLFTHLGNFAFWATMDFFSPRIKRGNEAPAIALIIVFCVTTLILFIVDSSIKAGVNTQETQDLAASTQEIIDGGSANTTLSMGDDPGFIGRYPSGPENAPIRIVIFSDYQCQDCKLIESQLITLLGERSDLLVSTKHFPFGKDCNPLLATDVHPQACRAAAYAEAFGMVGGPEAFWRAHFWLFENMGSVTDDQVIDFLNELGIDRDEFQRALTDPEIAKRILADIDEGRELGLYFTPMVFINGVQLRGYRAPNALINAVNSIAATNPPPGYAYQDTPDKAFEKYIQDWSNNERVSNFITPGTVTIDVIGDYTHGLSAAANKEILALIGDDKSVIYRFHPFPFDRSCNSLVRSTERPLGCDAALLVEAARFYGGDAAAFAVGQMILQGTMTDGNFYGPTTINDAADLIGADPYDLQQIMNSPDVRSLLTTEIQTQGPRIFRGIPTVYINGKNLPRWQMKGEDVLSTVYDRATEDAAARRP